MKKPKKTHYDSPWKTITGKHFQSFMAFYFPKAHKDIDWTQGFESKDGELQKILPEQNIEKKIVDKLTRVILRDGRRTWVYIHVEFQNQYDPNFSKRVYTSHYRIFDYFKEQVVSLAILGDERAAWMPDEYREEIWDMSLHFKFPIVKLLTYNDRREWLEAHDNPFAYVTMAHLKSLETRQDMTARLNWKIHLVEALLARNWDKKTIIDLLRFTEWLYQLPDNLEIQYKQTVSSLGGRKMEYLAAFEREAMEKGLEKGIEKGIEKGKLGVIAKQLKLKFGVLPGWVEKKLETASDEQSELWTERILTAQSFEEVFSDN